MDRVRQLALTLALLLLSVVSYAQTCQFYSIVNPATGSGNLTGYSLAAACGSAAAAMNNAGVGYTYTANASSGACVLIRSDGAQQVEPHTVGACSSCPGGVPRNADGTCPTAPTGPTCPSSGVGAGRWDFDTGSTAAPSLSADRFVCTPLAGGTATQGCVVRINGDMATPDPATGNWIVYGSGSYATGTCNPTTNGSGASTSTTKGTEATGQNNSPNSGQCSFGKVPGQVNGSMMCVNPGATTPTVKEGEKKTVTTHPDGAKTEYTESTVTSKDATGKVTDTTTQTTIVRDPSGAIASTQTATVVVTRSGSESGSGGGGDGDGDGSSFGGSCGGAVAGSFSCEGDAATCAIARAVNEARCLLTPSSGILAVSGQLEAGTFGSQLPTQAKNLGTFTQTNPFSDACPADYSFSAGGIVDITVPFASYCSVLQMMGNILVALTLIGATVFVIRGIGGN